MKGNLMICFQSMNYFKFLLVILTREKNGMVTQIYYLCVWEYKWIKEFFFVKEGAYQYGKICILPWAKFLVEKQ